MNVRAPMLVAFLLLLPWFGCQREPTIIIRFDAADLAGSTDAAPPIRDAGIIAAPRPAIPMRPSNAPTTACQKDADCVAVSADCCDCANGGRLRAVLKREEEQLTAQKHKACKDVMCTMMASTDPTCGKRPACLEGHCALRDARPDEVKHRLPARSPQ